MMKSVQNEAVRFCWLTSRKPPKVRRRAVRTRSFDHGRLHGIKPPSESKETKVAKKTTKKKSPRKSYTASDIKLLKAHSKARTPVLKLAKMMKRSEGSLRQKALSLAIGLGHQR
jgi:hypothetical protein